MNNFAYYTDIIINKLPFWFKIKKDRSNSLGADFLNVFGITLDEVHYMLNYAYRQTKIDTADLHFTDIVYKCNIPSNLKKGKDFLVYGSPDLLEKADNLENFFDMDIKNVDYIEDYCYHKYFYDDIHGIVYVKKPYNRNTEYEYGQIKITYNNEEYDLPLKLHHVWNFFDEFGLLLNCPRLFGENNYNYKNRILDVFINIAGANRTGLLNGIARELNLRKNILWEDGSKNIIIDDTMIVLNNIKVDGELIPEENVFIDEFNRIILLGNIKYKSISRQISFVSGIEMHQMSNTKDIKIMNELYYTNNKNKDLLKYYAEKINSISSIFWDKFRYNETYWDLNKSESNGYSFVPSLYDGSISGFKDYK